jgi:hypothetical protein
MFVGVRFIGRLAAGVLVLGPARRPHSSRLRLITSVIPFARRRGFPVEHRVAEDCD